MSGLNSYLKLAKEKIFQEFAQALIQKAPAIFFAKNDKRCVYNKFDVGGKIINQFGFVLGFLFEKQEQTNLVGIGQIAQPNSFFVPLSEEKIFIDSTQFDTTQPQNAIRWKTRVRFVRLFRKQALPPVLPPSLNWMNETIRIQSFDVFWTSDIDDQANFLTTELAEIKIAEQATEPASWNKYKYGFPQETPPSGPLNYLG